jgi:hypothetical protein
MVPKLPNGPAPALDRFSLRQATRRDAEAIARILEAPFAAYKAQYTADAYRATVPDCADISRPSNAKCRRVPDPPALLASIPIPN